jgi:hypothetical protein
LSRARIQKLPENEHGCGAAQWDTEENELLESEMAVKHRKSKTKSTRRWSGEVKTDSTHPPAGLFTKSAPVIARTLASKRVSPKGPGSGMRMLTFYINRAGHNLSESRRAELERAKELLSEWSRGAKRSKSKGK